MTMEKRALIAALLMAALLVVYQMFFFPTPQEAPAPRPVAPPATPAPPSAARPLSAASTTPPPAAPRPLQRLASVETPHYSAVVSSEGGKLQEFVLKYRGGKPMVIVGDLGPAGLLIAADVNRPLAVVPMTLSADRIAVSAERPTQDLVLAGEIDGIRVRQRLTFHADDFAIDVALRVENPARAPRTVTLALPWLTREAWHGTAEKFQGQHPTEVVWSSNGHVERIEDLTAVGERVSDGEWIALGSVWYLAALIPKAPGFKLVATSEGKPPEPTNGDKAPAGRASIALRATLTIAPGEAWEGGALLYAGPKEYERLRAHSLQETINFGGFPLPRRWGGLPMEWLGVPILLLMNWVYKHVGNYGLAIILLTVVTRVLFYPLTVKSMRSMKAMQALSPQVNALRNKYKSDPQRLQKETLELYRKYKVNPLGGCLPMFAQIPIFYALYLALSASVDLQNAAFICFGHLPAWVPLLGGRAVWICDLADKDPTFILPIVMGVTMFIQQKMTPTTGDPRQAKMMLMMPFVFTYMFLWLASGLVLYWTVSNILQIAQQWWMNRPARVQAEREAKDAGRA
jgi:YidC/Oxa1 family membrane protein insertase